MPQTQHILSCTGHQPPQAVQRQVNDIDRNENLSINFDAREWFVCTMTKQANSNQKLIQSVLRSIETKLELLSSDGACMSGVVCWIRCQMLLEGVAKSRVIPRMSDAAVILTITHDAEKICLCTTAECPICLEPIEAADVTVLGCCHRVCSECWTHWKSMRGGQAFCPLCRYSDFISEISTISGVTPADNPAPPPPPTPAPAPAPAAGGGFGFPPPTPAPVSGGGFGFPPPTPAPVSGGGFGFPAPTPAPVSGGGFGFPAPTPAPAAGGGFGFGFGAPASGNLFALISILTTVLLEPSPLPLFLATRSQLVHGPTWRLGQMSLRWWQWYRLRTLTCASWPCLRAA